MKEKLKVLVRACMIACFAFVLTACSQSSAEQTVDQTKIDQAGQIAETMFQQFIALPDDQIDELIADSEDDQDTVLAAGLNSWKSSKEDLGALISVDGVETEVEKNGAFTVTVNATFEQRTCAFVMGIDRRMQEYTELTFTPHYTVAENLEEAASNLVVGMGTVFIVLIFIAWVISLFKYIGKIGQKSEKKAAPVKAAPVVKVDPAVDDQTLLVIMAAISAYESGETTFTPYIQTSEVPVCDNGITIKSTRKR